MTTFLFKTEPTEYSFSDLVREGETTWTGVNHPAARKALRSVRSGDEIFIYHTGAERAIVGVATAACDAYTDPNRKGEHVDGGPLYPVVDIRPIRAAQHEVELATIKADLRFSEFALVRQGRLSAMEVSPALVKVLKSLMSKGS